VADKGVKTDSQLIKRPRKAKKPRAPKGVINSPPLPVGKVVTTETPPTATPGKPITDLQAEQVARKVLKPTRYLEPTTTAIRTARKDFWEAGKAQRDKLVKQANVFLRETLEMQPRSINIRVGGHVRSYRPRMPVKNGTLPVFNVAVLLTVDGLDSIKSTNLETITLMLQDVAYWSTIKDISLRPGAMKSSKNDYAPGATNVPFQPDNGYKFGETNVPYQRILEDFPDLITQSPKPQRLVRMLPSQMMAWGEATTDEV